MISGEGLHFEVNADKYPENFDYACKRETGIL